MHIYTKNLFLYTWFYLTLLITFINTVGAILIVYKCTYKQKCFVGFGLYLHLQMSNSCTYVLSQ